MKKLQKLFIYIINLPLYYISKLIPKSKKIWIFGAWFGEKYADNSKYFFEYVNNHDPTIKAIWLTKNKETLKLVRKKGYKAYYSYSIKGYWITMRAYLSFVSTGISDVNRFVFTGKCINLWHGIPLKKIGYDDRITNKILKKRSIKEIVFPFIRKYEFFYKIIASSKTDANLYRSAFNKKISNIWITGLPRNDVFFNKKHYTEEFNIIYMPTHRKEGEFDVNKLFLNNINDINHFLKGINAILYIKLHYYHMKNMQNLNYSNIKMIFDKDIEQDIYTNINSFDILITDYSSIYFDYLLSNKPIIFAPFDLEEYLKKDREFYFDYNEVTPGPKCKNWNEVLEWINKFKNNPQLYEEERKKIRNMFHKYQDGQNSKRVYEMVKRFINE